MYYDSGHLLFFITVGLRGGFKHFIRDFINKLAPHCRALSVSFKIDKIKAPLVTGPLGAVDTNNWCKSFHYQGIVFDRHLLHSYFTIYYF